MSIYSDDNNESANVIAVTMYESITPEVMLMMLKSGLNDFTFSCVDDYTKSYVEETMGLIKEYIYRLEVMLPDVGVIRFANRGLEALMSIREDIALKRSCDIWSDNNPKNFKKNLIEDSLNNVICEMYENVHELVNNANFEALWKSMSLSGKNDLLKKWNMTWKDCSNDISASSIPYTKREMLLFEYFVGKEFEEFNQYLRA